MAEVFQQHDAAVLGASGGSLRDPGAPATIQADPQLASRLILFARGGAAFAVVLGLLVLVGWALDHALLKSVVPGWVTMKVNSALGFILSGAALWVLQGAPSRAGGRLLAGACAGLVVALGLATLGEDLAGWNLGIDQLLFKEPASAVQTSSPGRMAPTTAFNFLLLGSALLFLAAPAPGWQRIGVPLAFAVLIVSALAAFGYAYGVQPLYRVAVYTSMAAHTSATFVALSLAVLLACSPHGWTSLLVSHRAGGTMLRRAWLPTILFLVLLGALTVREEPFGIYDTEIGLALTIVSVFAVLTALLWRGAAVLDRSETERQGETEARANLAAIVESSGDAIVSCAPDGVVVSWNAGAEQLFGYTAAEIAGRNIALIAPPDRRYEMVHHVWLLEYGKSMPPFETVRVTKDGREIRVQMGVSAIRDDGGKLIRYSAIFREPTERERVQNAVRESQRRLAMLMDNLPGMAYRRRNDPNWTVEFLSRGCHALTGYPPENLVKNRNIAYADIILPEDRQPVWDLVQRALALREHFVLEYRIRSASGDVKWVWEQGCGVYGIGGELVALEGLILDITERKHAEAERGRLAAIVETSEDAIFSRALHGTVLTWNGGAERMFGYTVAEMVGRNISVLAPPELAQMSSDNTEALLRGETVPPFETVRLAKGARAVEVQISISPLRDDTGKITGASGIMRDITQRKRAEERRAQLAEIVEGSRDAIVSTATDGTVLTWNSGAERLFGYSAAEAVGRDVAFLSPEDRRHELGERRRATLADRGVQSHESERVAKDGRRVPVSISASALHNAVGNATSIALIFRDLTPWKLAQRDTERKARMTELLEALARTVNEALDAKEGMRACLELIRDHGKWTVARLALLAPEASPPQIVESVWYGTDAPRYAEFTRLGAAHGSGDGPKRFISLVLRDQGPVWVEDIGGVHKTGRLVAAVAAGLRSAFAFPVIAAGKVVAFLEFFSEEMRRPDELILQAALRIGSQLARLIERQGALETAHEKTRQMLLVTENMPAMLAYFDSELRCRYANHAYCEFHVVDPHKVTGMTLPEIVGHDTYEKTLASTIPRVMAGKPVTVRREHRTAAGEVRHIEIRRVPDLDAAERVCGYYAMLLDVTEEVRQHRERERKAALSQLMETLARAVSEAASPEAAMRTCLEQICEHGGWSIGRLGIYGPGEDERFPENSLWHTKDTARHQPFMRASLDPRYFAPGGRFITTVLKERRAVWLHDISSSAGFGRIEIAASCGLRSAFAFPVILGDTVTAFLEFFADEPREADGLLLEAIGAIGSQLARAIERQRALDEVRASEQKLAGILSALHEVVWSMDVPSGRILYLNPAVKRLTRRPITDFLADNRLWRRMVHPDDRRRVRDSIRALFQKGEITQEFRIVLADGEVRTVEDRSRVVCDAQGAPQRIDGTIDDITERKQAEETRDQLAAIVDSSIDAIVGGTVHGDITSWNAAAERLYGYTAKEILGKGAKFILTPPELHEQTKQNRELVGRGILVPPFETVRLRKDGQRIDVQLSISPIQDRAGNVIGMSTISRDITERKRAEAERAQLAAIVESSNDAIIGRAFDGTIISWNGGAERLLGWTAQEAIGRPGAFVIPLDRHDRIGANDKKIRNGEIVAPHETQRIRKNGQLIDVMSSISPIRDESGTVIGASNVLQDISALKAAQATARESDERLRATFEQASVGMALRAIDPRNPRLLQVNQKLCDVLGYTREELLQLDPLGITSPEDRATAIDYNEQLLRGETTSYSREKRYVHKNGSIIWADVSVSAMRGSDGCSSHVMAVVQDITQRKQAEERADFLAQYDVLTGLPNRRLFADRLKLAMARDRRLGKMTALLFVDLDRFKQVNETMGHSAGDETLRKVSERLRERLREVDTIARLGGDEFAVIIESVTQSAQPLRVAKMILEALVEPFAIKDEEVFINASIGAAISVSSADRGDMDTLMENAELAMYQAKQEGRNNVQLYVSDPPSRRNVSLNMESRLRRAVERDELVLNFQPKVDMRTGAITAAEALVRWRNPDLGLVSPADFIPLAEETGIIVPIGEWVLHAACAEASAWQRLGHPIAISVNLSARQFRQKNLVRMIELALADSTLPPDRLELEITESMIMHRPEETIATLRRLNDMGLALSVDDFGTGYSSLSYLKRFPVHKLKIDRSFVREIHQNSDDAAIVRAVIALAKSLHLRTIAEGVETEQQLIFLAGLQCDEYQGYYFSKPLPGTEFLELLRTRGTGASDPASAAAASTGTADPRQATRTPAKT